MQETFKAPNCTNNSQIHQDIVERSQQKIKDLAEIMGVDLPGASQFTTSMHMFGKGPADLDDEEDEYQQSPYKGD